MQFTMEVTLGSILSFFGMLFVATSAFFVMRSQLEIHSLRLQLLHKDIAALQRDFDVLDQKVSACATAEDFNNAHERLRRLVRYLIIWARRLNGDVKVPFDSVVPADVQVHD